MSPEQRAEVIGWLEGLQDRLEFADYSQNENEQGAIPLYRLRADWPLIPNAPEMLARLYEALDS